MKLKLQGSKEDLIRKLDNCDYCIFEHIIPEESRKIKVLDLPVPERHPHRIIIEQICGRNYDGVCPMKYAAMRSMYDDFMASQFGAIKDFIWDLGKTVGQEVNYEEGMREWAKKQDLGNKTQESYAQRFREVWELGQRENKQNLTSTAIYEIVVAKTETYNQVIEVLEKLKQESEKRDKIKSMGKE